MSPAKRDDHELDLPRKNSSKAALIAGAIALGSLLLCGCGCGGWLIWLVSMNVTPEMRDQRIKEQAEAQWREQDRQATSDLFRAKAFVAYWLQLLQMKNLDEPYRLTSAAFQQRVPRAQFDAFIDARPSFRDPTPPQWSHGLDGRPGTRFGFLFHNPKGNYMLSAIKVGNEWRLDQIEKSGPP